MNLLPTRSLRRLDYADARDDAMLGEASTRKASACLIHDRGYAFFETVRISSTNPAMIPRISPTMYSHVV